jgi:hypothetical protein
VTEAAERQARKLEFSLAWDFQRKEDRAADLLALKELTKILRELASSRMLLPAPRRGVMAASSMRRRSRLREGRFM